MVSTYKAAHLHARRKNRVKKSIIVFTIYICRCFARMSNSEDRCGSGVVLTKHEKASGRGKVRRLSKNNRNLTGAEFIVAVASQE